MDQIQQQIDTFINSLGFEEMEAGTYRKGDIDIFLKVVKHDDTCAHFNCNNKQVEGTDSCKNHQFCTCEKVQGKHYTINH